MTLAAIQRAFQAHIVASDAAVADRIAPTGRRGLPVYHHAYRATLRDALRDTYARTALWIGDDAFDDAAEHYIAATPSISWTLANYGRGFPEHLAAAFPADPEIGELAWLEDALRLAFAAAEPGGPLDMSQVDWDRAVLQIAPAAAARQVTTDVAGIWHALHDERAPEHYRLAGPIGLIVWREGLIPRFRTADPAEAWLLQALIAGRRFAAACAELGDVTPDTVGGWMADWIRGGMIAGINHGE